MCVHVCLRVCVPVCVHLNPLQGYPNELKHNFVGTSWYLGGLVVLACNATRANLDIGPCKLSAGDSAATLAPRVACTAL